MSRKNYLISRSEVHAEICECAECVGNALCGHCNGSGEGPADGTTCSTCGGGGEDYNDNEVVFIEDHAVRVFEGSDEEEEAAMAKAIEVIKGHYRPSLVGPLADFAEAEAELVREAVAANHGRAGMASVIELVTEAYGFR